MATKKSKSVAELEQELVTLRTLVGVGLGRPVVTGKPVVGIRNVSSYTVGLVNKLAGEEGEVQLHAEAFGQYNPSARAVVSAQFWAELKKSAQVRKGMVIRDDSFVTDGNIADPDRATDFTAEVQANIVIDPFQWIEERSDAEIIAGLRAMTSEPTLRRMLAAVDFKVWQIGEELYKDDELRAKKAVRDLPGKYRLVEQIALERLDDFRPNAKNYANEAATQARF